MQILEPSGNLNYNYFSASSNRCYHTLHMGYNINRTVMFKHGIVTADHAFLYFVKHSDSVFLIIHFVCPLLHATTLREQ